MSQGFSVFLVLTFQCITFVDKDVWYSETNNLEKGIIITILSLSISKIDIGIGSCILLCLALSYEQYCHFLPTKNPFLVTSKHLSSLVPHNQTCKVFQPRYCWPGLSVVKIVQGSRCQVLSEKSTDHFYSTHKMFITCRI